MCTGPDIDDAILNFGLDEWMKPLRTLGGSVCRNNLNHLGPVNRLWGTDFKVAFHNSFLLAYTPLYISFPLVVGMPKWKACYQRHSNHGMCGTNIHLTYDCTGKWTRKNYMEHSQVHSEQYSGSLVLERRVRVKANNSHCCQSRSSWSLPTASHLWCLLYHSFLLWMFRCILLFIYYLYSIKCPI